MRGLSVAAAMGTGSCRAAPAVGTRHIRAAARGGHAPRSRCRGRSEYRARYRRVAGRFGRAKPPRDPGMRWKRESAAWRGA